MIDVTGLFPELGALLINSTCPSVIVMKFWRLSSQSCALLLLVSNDLFGPGGSGLRGSRLAMGRSSTASEANKGPSHFR